MKIKYLKQPLYLLFSLALIFTSCEEEVIKSDYEKVDESKLPSIALTVSDITYESASASASISISGDDLFSEKGFIISNDETFITAETVIIADNEDFSNTLTLAGSTKYFVKAYTLSQNGIATSEAFEFTTPEAPKFEDTYLYGTYTETDYDLTGAIEAVYENGITISAIEGSANKMSIENFWDGGETITASVDFENKTITINPQVIYVSADYGDCYIYYLYQSGEEWSHNPEEIISGTYDEDGNITIDSWGAGVSAGFFGQYLKTELVKTN